MSQKVSAMLLSDTEKKFKYCILLFLKLITIFKSFIKQSVK